MFIFFGSYKVGYIN